MDSSHTVSSIPDHLKSKTELASARPKQCPLGHTWCRQPASWGCVCTGGDWCRFVFLFKETQITSQSAQVNYAAILIFLEQWEELRGLRLNNNRSFCARHFAECLRY